jgi:hypothetical protein
MPDSQTWSRNFLIEPVAQKIVAPLQAVDLIFQFADLPIVSAAAVEPVYPLFQFPDALFVFADLFGDVPILAMIVAVRAVVLVKHWEIPEQAEGDPVADVPRHVISPMPGLKIQGSGHEQPDD